MEINNVIQKIVKGYEVVIKTDESDCVIKKVSDDTYSISSGTKTRCDTEEMLDIVRSIMDNPHEVSIVKE